MKKPGFLKRIMSAMVIACAMASLATGSMPASVHAADDEVSRKTASVLERAEERIEDGERDKAVDVLNARLDDTGMSDSDKAALLMVRARAYAAGEGGDLVAAESDLQAALSLSGVPNYQRDEIVVALAELYVFQGSEEAALGVLEEYNATYGASDDILRLIEELQIATGARIPTDLADRPLTPTRTTAPRFPAACARNAAAYTVSVVFDVTASGVVENVRVVESTDPCLEEAAMSAVSNWAFDPAVQSGYFVKTRDVPVTVTFSAR